ncbi:MAG: LdpA C-terminal domain-containing domain [Prochlorococcaceae cyanobacterium]
MAAARSGALSTVVLADPDTSLMQGRWVKLIAGASNQDLPAIEDLAGLYGLAGIDCIDVAADPAVVAAARRGLAWAAARMGRTPWLMVSLSDGDDPHFRKAWFDPRRCPPGCPRPCARVCPAAAIGPAGASDAGVLADRCYGCGRCRPACPLGLIEERSQVLHPAAVAPLLQQLAPDAVELHTRLERSAPFRERLRQVIAAGVPLRRVAVSCGLEGGASPGAPAPSPERLAATFWSCFADLRRAGLRPLWQLDGRPMSGDVGAGTAHAAVRLFQRVAALAPPGPLQLAGGTNAHTLELLRRARAAAPLPACAGVAFGSVARARLQPWLARAQERGVSLLAAADLWPEALREARALVQPWRSAGART